jgi:hypothetical protein
MPQNYLNFYRMCIYDSLTLKVGVTYYVVWYNILMIWCGQNVFSEYNFFQEIIYNHLHFMILKRIPLYKIPFHHLCYIRLQQFLSMKRNKLCWQNHFENITNLQTKKYKLLHLVLKQIECLKSYFFSNRHMWFDHKHYRFEP